MNKYLAYTGGTRYAWHDSDPLRSYISYQTDYALYNDRATSYVSRLSWLGKERDHTSTSLSASGVRKYNSASGRFMSVDPQPHAWVWEKYLSRTPYQYE